jgi:hypothetical protein
MIRIKKFDVVDNLTYINDEIAHGVYVDEHGNLFWYQDGLRHRDNDKPAIIGKNNSKFWYQNGLRHRDGNKPAIVFNSGKREWYKNGIKQRVNI